MAIVKRLQVLTPHTSNGSTASRDNSGKDILVESILPLTAEKNLRSVNNKRPNGLKHQISIVSYNTVKRTIVDENAPVEAAAETEVKAKAKSKGGKSAKAELDELELG